MMHNTMMGHVHIYAMLLFRCFYCETILDVPGLDHQVYHNPGDITLGMLMGVRRYSSENYCSDDYITSDIIKSEIGDFMTDLINANPSILPNISLGFLIVDDCQKDLTALARSITFVQGAQEDYEASCSNTTEVVDVVGVVGPSYSSQAVMVSSFLGLFNIPVLSTTASSDELSDKSRFQYFARLVLPDNFQSVAMVDVLQYFNWSYVSLVYSEGTYGENGAKLVSQKIQENGYCIASSRRISSDANVLDIDLIVNDIAHHMNAKVIILYLEVVDISKFFGGLKRAGLSSEFLFLVSDMLPDIQGMPHEEVASGALFLAFSSGEVYGFTDHLRKINWRNTSNPWLPALWNTQYQCNWTDTSLRNDPCQDYDSLITEVTRNYDWSFTSKYADGILVYALALHSLIQDNCPEQFIQLDKSKLYACINGSSLLKYVKDVEVQGYADFIAFDDSGDALGQYLIQQYRWSDEDGRSVQTIGEWNKLKGTLHLNFSLLDPDAPMNPAMGVESVCSKPCGAGEYYQFREFPCCWDCRLCRTNEIVINMTTCRACPLNKWPNPDTKTICEDIVPQHLKSSDAIGICILCIGSVGISMAIAIIIVYVVRSKNRLLKATSRELSMSTIIGCLMACSVAMLFVKYPNNFVCPVCHLGFHLSITVTYSPLFVKTTRIYRIFNAGKKGNGRPVMISSKAQLIFTFILVLIQGFILIIIQVEVPSIPKLIMPFTNEPYVEITCSVMLVTFIVPLCYNMVIIVSCGAFGFLTRKLPQNFNDSKYIFVSMSTTFFMWLVFVPTYFTTFHSHYKAVLLAMCLFLNAYITMLCQFVPKIYAVFFVKDEAIAIKTNNTAIGEHSTM